MHLIHIIMYVLMFIFLLLFVRSDHRRGTIPEITMRYVSRYLGHDTIRIMILH